MAKYKCSVCGYIYDEAALGAISNLEKCPVCVYSKIAEMKVLIENAEIIEKTELDADTVSLSSHVKLRDLDENDEIEYQIVGSQEANPMQGRISDESPIGRAIIGHRVGETVTVEAPAGQMRFTIMSVSNE